MRSAPAIADGLHHRFQMSIRIHYGTEEIKYSFDEPCAAALARGQGSISKRWESRRTMARVHYDDSSVKHHNSDCPTMDNFSFCSFASPLVTDIVSCGPTGVLNSVNAACTHLARAFRCAEFGRCLLGIRSKSGGSLPLWGATREAPDPVNPGKS